MVRRNKTKKMTKRMAREVISPIIRRPNAASTTSFMSVPYWAYSSRKQTRKHKTK